MNPDINAVIHAESTFAPVPTGILKSDATSRAVVTYAVLRTYVRPGRQTFPKFSTMAEQFGLSESFLKRGVAELRDLGFLVVTKKDFAAGFRQVNCYYFPNIPDGPVTSDQSEGVKTDTSVRVTPDTSVGVTGDTLYEVEETEVEEVEEPSSAPADAAARPEIDRLCQLLADRIAANGTRRPNITKKWRDAARLLMDKDGYTEEQVAWIINWCQADEFWRTNILSMPKLREKFNQLKLKAVARSKPRTAVDRRVEANAEVAQAWLAKHDAPANFLEIEGGDQ